MAVDLEIIARLVALEQGRGVPVASHLQVAIQPDALVLCCIALAGEDTSVHIVACGRLGQPAEFRSVPDPRFRDDQYDLFAWIGQRIEQYYAQCRQRLTHPQIWVSSDSAVKHLDVLADRLRYNRDRPDVRRFGELLTYATERYPVGGQQSLHAATAALRQHYVTGQQAAEDEHLGTLLTWIDPPLGRNVQAAVALVEQTPMGVKTDPEFDRGTLERLVKAYDDARRAGAPLPLLTRRARNIHDALQNVIAPIYQATQTAVNILLTRWPRTLLSLPELQAREAQEFESFMQSRDGGFFLPLRDKPKAAAFKLTERENALQTIQAAICMGDRVALAKARLGGRILEGSIENPRRVRVRPRIFQSTFDLVSVQRVLRVRPRDELVLLSDPRQTVIVRSVERQGRRTRVQLEILKGKNAVGLPVAGSSAVFTPSVPDWNSLTQARIQLAERLAVQPWTHADNAAMPGRSPSQCPRPADLLAAVEGLR
jgi:hypothetical protein